MSNQPNLEDNLFLFQLSIQQLHTTAYRIPTDSPEADGTAAWNSTTMALVRIEAGGKIGIGYSYADEATAFFINNTLKDLAVGQNALDIPGINLRITRRIRNSGTCGITMMAVSAVDNALWDLKAKILTIYYSDKDPVGPFKITVPARRTRHIRFNDLNDPETIPLKTDFSILPRFNFTPTSFQLSLRFVEGNEPI